MAQNMTTAELAAELRIAPETCRYWRHTKQGPASFKVGGRVLYRRLDVDAWIAEQYAASNPEAS